MSKLQFNRGLKGGKPVLSPGEPYLATDTQELIVGTGAGDVSTLGAPKDNSVTTVKIVDNAVTYLKLSSAQKAWKAANGFTSDTDLIIPHTSLPNNFAIADKNGNYNWAVEIPRKNWDPTNGFAASTIHPAFMVNGVQKRIFIGKYQASARSANVPQSLPNKIPVVSQTFDQQLTDCNALNGNGVTGWHMKTNAEWALIDLISKNLGVTVYGNNNYGRDVDDKSVTFRLNDPTLFGGATGDAKSFVGSGGVKSSHNNQLDGIFDMNGNVWERVSGMRLNNGEINIFVNNDAADSTKDFSSGSPNWKAILEDGSLVAPGTALTLKVDASGNIATATGGTSGSKTFETIGVSGISAASAGITLLKKLLLYPHTTGLFSDNFWFNNTQESIPIRGGYWNDGMNAGLFALHLYNTRSNSLNSISFRLAFVL